MSQPAEDLAERLRRAARDAVEAAAALRAALQEAAARGREVRAATWKAVERVERAARTALDLLRPPTDN